MDTDLGLMKELLEEKETQNEISDQNSNHLIIWNDEVNTFDWVIKALIEICDYSPQQAEQCSLIIHFKGKYAVKSGDFETLRPMCESFIDRGINATID